MNACVGLTAFVVVCSFMPVAGNAQCRNTTTPSCDVYASCFAKYCPCSGQSEYFLSYGKKYCERFLASNKLSEAGKKWRNATLRCLQEKIIPRLDISEHPTCNCSAMRQYALDTHVSCYTEPEASICKLSWDIFLIPTIPDLKDVFSKEGWATMCAIGRVCVTQTETVDNPEEELEMVSRHLFWQQAVAALCPG